MEGTYDKRGASSQPPSLELSSPTQYFPRFRLAALRDIAHDPNAMNDGEEDENVPPMMHNPGSLPATSYWTSPVAGQASGLGNYIPDNSPHDYGPPPPEDTNLVEHSGRRRDHYEYYRTRIVEEELPDPRGGPLRKRRVVETVGKRPINIPTGDTLISNLIKDLWEFFYPSAIAYITLIAVIISTLFVNDVKAERLVAARSKAQEYQLQWAQNACDAHPLGLETQCEVLDELRHMEAHLSGGWYLAIFTVLARASAAPVSYFGREFAAAVSEMSVTQMLCMILMIPGLLKGVSWLISACSSCKKPLNDKK